MSVFRSSTYITRGDTCRGVLTPLTLSSDSQIVVVSLPDQDGPPGDQKHLPLPPTKNESESMSDRPRNSRLKTLDHQLRVPCHRIGIPSRNLPR